MEEERTKKLRAGKEKLAAFQKKKAKRKKPKERVSDKDGQPITESSTDISSASDAASYEDSDQFSGMSSEDEAGESNGNIYQRSYFHAQRELAHSVERIAELEESLMGKQMALDKVIRENEELQREISSTKEQTTEREPCMEEPIVRETALPLQALDRQTQQDYMAQTQQLASQVQVLHGQLQQAGNALQSQMNKQTVSALALTDAKTEIINLRERLSEKDGILNQLASKVTEISGEYSNLKNSFEIMKRKESETELIVQHLMEDIEEARAQKPRDTALSPPPTSPRLSEDQRLAHLRAELEEMYAKQIVSMKEQFLEQQENEVGHVTEELRDIKTEHEKSLMKIAEYQVQLQEYEILIGQIERVQQENLMYINSNDELKNKINMQHDVVMNLKIEMDALLQDNQSYRDQIVLLREKCDLENAAMVQVSSEKEILIVRLEEIAYELEVIKQQNETSESCVSDSEQIVKVHEVCNLQNVDLGCDSDGKEHRLENSEPDVESLFHQKQDLEREISKLRQEKDHIIEQSRTFSENIVHDENLASSNINALNSSDFETMQESLLNALSENDLLKKEISDIKERNILADKVSNRVQDSEVDIPESFKLQLENLETDNKELVLLNQKMQNDLKSVLDEKNALSVEKDQLLAEKLANEQEQTRLQEQVDELTTDIKGLSETIVRYESELESAKDEICHTKEEKQILNSQISELQLKISEAEQEKTVLMGKVENWRQELLQYANEQETLTNEINGVKQQNEVLKTELESTRQDLSIAKKEKEELNSQIQSFQSVKKDENQEMVLMNKLETTQQELFEFAQKHEQLVEDFKSVKLDNEKLQAELEQTSSNFLDTEEKLNSLLVERNELLTGIDESQIKYSSLQTEYNDISSRLSEANIWRSHVSSLLEAKAHFVELLTIKKHTGLPKKTGDSHMTTGDSHMTTRDSHMTTRDSHMTTGDSHMTTQMTDEPNIISIEMAVDSCSIEEPKIEKCVSSPVDISGSIHTTDIEGDSEIIEKGNLEMNNNVDSDVPANVGAGDAKSENASCEDGDDRVRTLQCDTVSIPMDQPGEGNYRTLEEQIVAKPDGVDFYIDRSSVEQVPGSVVSSSTEFLEEVLEKVDQLLCDRENLERKIDSKEREIVELTENFELTVAIKNELQQEIEDLKLASVEQAAHNMDLESINKRDVENVKEELRSVKDELASLLSSISQHSTQIEDLRTQSQQDQALAALQAQTEIEDYKSKLSSVEIELEEYKIKIAELGREKEELIGKENHMRNEFEKQKELLVDKYQQEYETLQVQLQELKDKEIDSGEVQLADLNENLKVKDLELKCLTEERNELSEQIEHYIEQVTNYSGQMEKLQRDMSDRELVHNEVLKNIETEKAVLTNSLEETLRELDVSKGDNQALRNQIRFIQEEKAEVDRLETMRMSQEEILELTANYEQTRENLYQILKENEELKYQQELNWAASDDIKQQWVDEMEHYKTECESGKASIVEMSRELDDLKSENAHLKSNAVSVADPSKDKCIEELVQQNVELRQMVQSANEVAGEQLKNYQSDYEAMKQQLAGIQGQLDYLTAENLALKHVIDSQSPDTVSKKHVENEITKFKDDNMALKMSLEATKMQLMEAVDEIEKNKEKFERERKEWESNRPDLLSKEVTQEITLLDREAVQEAGQTSNMHGNNEVAIDPQTLQTLQYENRLLAESLDNTRSQVFVLTSEIDALKDQLIIHRGTNNSELESDSLAHFSHKQLSTGKIGENGEDKETQTESCHIEQVEDCTQTETQTESCHIEQVEDCTQTETQTESCYIEQVENCTQTETQTECCYIEQVEDCTQTEYDGYNLSNSETPISIENVESTSAMADPSRLESEGVKSVDTVTELFGCPKNSEEFVIQESENESTLPSSSKTELEKELSRIKAQAEDFGEYTKRLEGQLSSLEDMLEVPASTSSSSENPLGCHEEKRFEKLNRCLNETLRKKENLSLELENINKELSQVMNENDVLKMNNEILKSELEMLSGESLDINPVIEQLKEQLRSVSCDHNKLKTYTEQLESEISQLSDNRDQLKSQLDIILSEMSALTDSSSTLNVQLEASKSDREKLSKINKTLGDKIASMRHQFQDLSDNSNRRVQELNDDREKYNDTVRQNEELLGQNRKLEEEVVYLVSKQSEDREELINKMTQQYDELMRAKEKLEAEKEELIRQNESAASGVDGNETAVTLLQLERAKLQLSQDTMVADLQDMQMKFENVQSMLENTKKNCEREVEQFKTDFESVTRDMTFLNDTVQKLEADLEEVTDEKEQLKELLSRHQANVDNSQTENQHPQHMNEKKIKDLQNRTVAFEQHIAQMELEDDFTEEVGTIAEMKLTVEVDTQTDLTGELQSKVLAGVCETTEIVEDEGLHGFKTVSSVEEETQTDIWTVENTEKISPGTSTVEENLKLWEGSFSLVTQTIQTKSEEFDDTSSLCDSGTQTVTVDVDLINVEKVTETTLPNRQFCDSETQTETCTVSTENFVADVICDSSLSERNGKELVCQETQTDERSSHHDADVDKIVASYEKRVLEMFSEMHRLQNEYGVLKNMHDDEITGLKQTIERMKFEFESGDNDEKIPVSNDDGDAEPTVEENEHIEEVTEVTEKYLREREFELEERFALEFRDKEVELMHQLDVEKRDYKKELEQVFKHQVAAVRAEKDQAFVHALQKMRAEFDKRRKDEMEKLRLELLKDADTSVAGASVESRIGVVVDKLYRENQELAEARDALLQQIIMSHQHQEEMQNFVQEDSFDGNEEGFIQEEGDSQQSIGLEWEFSSQTSFDSGRNITDSGLADSWNHPCMKPDCQLLRERYQELVRQLPNPTFQEENLNDDLVFETKAILLPSGARSVQRDEFIAQELTSLEMSGTSDGDFVEERTGGGRERERERENATPTPMNSGWTSEDIRGFAPSHEGTPVPVEHLALASDLEENPPQELEDQFIAENSQVSRQTDSDQNMSISHMKAFSCDSPGGVFTPAPSNKDSSVHVRFIGNSTNRERFLPPNGSDESVSIENRFIADYSQLSGICVGPTPSDMVVKLDNPDGKCHLEQKTDTIMTHLEDEGSERKSNEQIREENNDLKEKFSGNDEGKPHTISEQVLENESLEHKNEPHVIDMKKLEELECLRKECARLRDSLADNQQSICDVRKNTPNFEDLNCLLSQREKDVEDLTLTVEELAIQLKEFQCMKQQVSEHEGQIKILTVENTELREIIGAYEHTIKDFDNRKEQLHQRDETISNLQSVIEECKSDSNQKKEEIETLLASMKNLQLQLDHSNELEKRLSDSQEKCQLFSEECNRLLNLVNDHEKLVNDHDKLLEETEAMHVESQRSREQIERLQKSLDDLCDVRHQLIQKQQEVDCSQKITEELENKFKEQAHIEQELLTAKSELKLFQEKIFELEATLDSKGDLSEVHKKLVDDYKTLEYELQQKETAMIHQEDENSKQMNILQQNISDLEKQQQRDLEDKNCELEEAVVEKNKEVSILTEQISCLKIELGEQNEKLNTLNKNSHELEADLETKNDELIVLNKDNSQLEKELEVKKDQLNTLNQNISDLEKQFQQRIEEKTSEANVLMQKLSDLETQLEEKNEELGILNSRICEMQANLANLQTNLVDKTEELNTLKQNISDLEKQVEQKIKEKTKMENDLTQKMADIETELADKTEELNTLNHNDSEVKLFLETKNDELNTLKQNNRDLEKQLEQGVQEKNEEMNDLTQTINDLKTQLDDKNGELNTLNIELNILKQNTNDLEKELQQGMKEKNEEVTVLTEKIQDLEQKLVEKNEELITMEQNISDLKKQGEQNVEERTKIENDWTQKVADIETELVDKTKELNTIKQNTSDLEKQVEQKVEERSKMENDWTQKMSDLETELADKNEELNTLNHNHSEVKLFLETKNDELNTLKQNNRDLEKQLEQELQENNEEMTPTINDLKTQLDEKNEELNILKQNTNDLEKELQQGMKEKNEEVTVLTEKIQDLEQKLVEKNEELITMEQNISDLEKQVEQKLEEKTKMENDWTQKMADIETELVDKTKELNIIKQNTSDLEKQVAQKVEERSKMENDWTQKMSDLETELADKNEELNTLNHNHSEVKLFLETKNDELNTLKQNNRDLEKQLKQGVQEKNEEMVDLTQTINDLKAQFDKKNDELNTLNEELIILKKNNNDLEKELQQGVKEKNEEVTVLTNKIHDLEQKLVEKNEELNTMEQNISDLEKQVEQEMEERSKMENDWTQKMADIETELADKTEELNTMEQNISDLEKQVEQEVEERTKIENDWTQKMADIKTELADKTEELNLMEQNISDLEKQVEQKVEERTKMENDWTQKMADIETELVDKTEELNTLNHNHSEVKLFLETKNVELNTLKQNNRDLEKQLEQGVLKKNEKMNDLTQTINDLKTQLDDKKEKMDTLNQHIFEMQTNLEVKNEDLNVLNPNIGELKKNLEEKMVELNTLLPKMLALETHIEEKNEEIRYQSRPLAH
ncbi:hypothetical protein ScPMuIL_016490 [Solemya velum]